MSRDPDNQEYDDIVNRYGTLIQDYRLYLTEGTSDKAYFIAVIQQPDFNFSVIAVYGRRGAVNKVSVLAINLEDDLAAFGIAEQKVAEKQKGKSGKPGYVNHIEGQDRSR